MRFLSIVAIVVLAASPVSGAAIRGDYLEARTSDVWTGPCFANGEVNLAGREATLAWRVTEGSWNGVALNGLSVVGIVRADEGATRPLTKVRASKSVVLRSARSVAFTTWVSIMKTTAHPRRRSMNTTRVDPPALPAPTGRGAIAERQ